MCGWAWTSKGVKQYQQALKKQLDAILDAMNAKQFTGISDYLAKSYEDAFFGVLYDLHGQGIPLIFPIDQEEATRAIQLDSKLSEGLYKRLGVDTQALKTEIRGSVSRGIASNASWGQVARSIQNRMNIGLNRAIRIARTEGHRIQNESRYDAQVKAKQRGANVVKQWDATLDRRTRSTHQQLDGQIREIEEPYVIPSNGRRGMYPGGFGVAAEDINCRCASLQRARWALDEAELQTLKERAAYFGLDKTDAFADFKKKYMEAAKTVEKTGESAIIETGGVLDNFSRKVVHTTYIEDLNVVNPNYQTGEYKWRNNCQRCVSAYEMRRRGYDVTAKPLPGKLEADYLAQWFEHAWNNAKREWCLSGSGKKQVEEHMELWGDGARAVVGVGFTSDRGHVFFAERINGKTMFIDPQNASADCAEYFKMALKGRTHVTRVDNLTPSEHIIDCCEDRR